MKNTTRILSFIAFLTCMLSVSAINYPTYRGPSIERGNDNSQIYVPMQSSPLPKPSAEYSASSGASLYSAQSTAGGALGQTESNKSLKSYGGGGNAGGTITSNSKVGGSNIGASGGSFNMPKLKSVATGSNFQSQDNPTLFGENPENSLRASVGPPPPNEDNGGENTEDNVLPLGNGIVALVLCCAAYVAAKRRKNNE